MFSVQSPQPAEAGAFATEFTQILNHGQLVMEYIRQGEQLANEIKMYEDMLRNVKNTAEPGVRADLCGHQRTRRDRAGWPGAGVFARQPRSDLPANVHRLWLQRAMPTTRITRPGRKRRWTPRSARLRAAGLQGQQLQSEQAVLNSLRGMAQNSDGRMQALQVLGQISEQQVQQLMKLRELMLADLSSKQAFQATVIQQQAARKRQRRGSSRFSPTHPDGMTYKPDGDDNGGEEDYATR